jgi:hypothetical protein
MPAMRLALTAPMWGVGSGGREKDGIAQVMELMNDYSLTRCVVRAHIARLPVMRADLAWVAAMIGRRFWR